MTTRPGIWADATILVVPCYNEAARLPRETFDTYAAAHSDVRFLFVNDGSTDNTQAVLEGLKQSIPAACDILMLRENRGKAEAVRVGMFEAARHRPTFVGYWDADLSAPLDELDRLRGVLERHPHVQMATGARVNLLGRSIRRKLSRHYMGRVFATVVAAMLKLPIYDSQCGAKLFRCSDELVGLLQEPFLARWVFDVEILARFIRARHGTNQRPAKEAIYELPLQSWVDVGGSKLRPRDFLASCVDLVRIYRRYRR